MGGFVFVGVILLFVILAVVGVAQAKHTNEQWAVAARRLGLSYEPAGLFSNRRMHGSRHGFGIEADTFTRGAGKNSSSYTRFRVRFPEPLGLGLGLTSEGFFSGIGTFFGAQDIEIGDRSFDSEVIVKGASPDRICEFLTPARRLRIRRFLSNHAGGSIDDREIAWNIRGVIRDKQRLVSTIETMFQLAWRLVDEREEDARLDQAMVAQDEGRPDDALRILQERNRAASTADRSAGDESVIELRFPDPIEERQLEGEILYLGGKRDAAHAIFEQALDDAPNDAELRDWVEMTAAPAPTRGAARGGDHAAAAPASAADRLDPESLCETLFGEGISSFAVARMFDERFAGRAIEWTGTLRRADSYGFDMVFGTEPGCKAVIDVHELPAATFGTRNVAAIVQLPREALDELKERMGQPITFTGQLAKADGLMRNVYVTGGEIVA